MPTRSTQAGIYSSVIKQLRRKRESGWPAKKLTPSGVASTMGAVLRRDVVPLFQTARCVTTLVWALVLGPPLAQ
jgi:hypothetical protein